MLLPRKLNHSKINPGCLPRNCSSYYWQLGYSEGTLSLQHLFHCIKVHMIENSEKPKIFRLKCFLFVKWSVRLSLSSRYFANAQIFTLQTLSLQCSCCILIKKNPSIFLIKLFAINPSAVNLFCETSHFIVNKTDNARFWRIRYYRRNQCVIEVYCAGEKGRNGPQHYAQSNRTSDTPISISVHVLKTDCNTLARNEKYLK